VIRRAADLICERGDALACIVSTEQGKPLRDAKGEIALSTDTLDWLADEGRRAYGRLIPPRVTHARLMVQPEPIGPVAALTPWNFPVLTPCRKIGAALAAGCSIILKASEETPGTAVEIVRAFHDAGLPDGVLQLVFGVPDQVSRHMLGSEIIRKVSFTGSVRVGVLLTELAAPTLKRLTLELGGHAPVVVFPDADLDLAIQTAAGYKFRNAGQVCVAPTRFFVHEAVHDDFVDRINRFVSEIVVGNGLEDRTTMGPLANARRVEAMEGFVADARSRGATVSEGGQRLGNQGYFFAPAVISGLDDQARIMREEPFGPLAPVARFREMDEVVERANALPFGLASYAFTRSDRTAREIGDRLEAGMVGINSIAISLPEAPFGGVKMSGDGQEGGIEGLDVYMVKKLIAHH